MTEDLRRELVYEWWHRKRYRELQWHLVDRARTAAQEFAASWRGFKVGCAVLAWKPSPTYRPTVLYDAEREEWFMHPVPRSHPDLEGYEVFPGYNIKPYPDWMNSCAERVAVRAAVAAGYTHIVGMAVTGAFQPDGETDIIAPTLRPCGVCRRTLPRFAIISEDLPIITAHLGTDDTIYEEFTLRQLIDSYPTAPLDDDII